MFELDGPGAARTRLEATAATRGLSRFVGRDTERAELESALEHALAGEGRAVGIVGDPGVGKSRLVREFVAGCAARGLPVISTGGVAHGRFVPFLSVLALFRDYFGVAELDAPEVARERIETTLLGSRSLVRRRPAAAVRVPRRRRTRIGRSRRWIPSARQRRLLDVMAPTVRARSRHEAAVLVVEDLHWIDDASEAFLEELVAAVAGTRIAARRHLPTGVRGRLDAATCRTRSSTSSRSGRSERRAAHRAARRRSLARRARRR